MRHFNGMCSNIRSRILQYLLNISWLRMQQWTGRRWHLSPRYSERSTQQKCDSLLKQWPVACEMAIKWLSLLEIAGWPCGPDGFLSLWWQSIVCFNKTQQKGRETFCWALGGSRLLRPFSNICLCAVLEQGPFPKLHYCQSKSYSHQKQRRAGDFLHISKLFGFSFFLLMVKVSK